MNATLYDARRAKPAEKGSSKAYSDAGNRAVVTQVPIAVSRILDVGCGSGDNARLLKARRPAPAIEGVTHSAVEAERAQRVLDRVHQFDLEGQVPESLEGPFDCLLFSHVLEHLRDPATALSKLIPLLRKNGVIVIAVPNILEWRSRLRLLRGCWEYEELGSFDRTHLRFFSFDSAPLELLGAHRSQISVERIVGDGGAPLGPLRRLPIFAPLTHALDGLALRGFPNLFAWQAIIVARLK